MMFVRNEKSYCKLFGTPFPSGAVCEVTEAQLEALTFLIEEGSLSVHKTDPTKEPAPKKTRARRKKKPSEEG